MPNLSITASTVVQRKAHLPTSEVADETVLLHLEQNHFYGMNQVGSRIWELLAEPTPVHALCAQLQSEFAVSPEECLADVLVFLQTMHGDGLIAVCPT
jgi:hypothetical protein